MLRRAVTVALTLVVTSTALAGFTEEQRRALDTARYVYIQSERRSGEWSTPAEIWFHVEGDTLYVGTRPTSWRVRRIKAGRRRARIAIGSPQGPAFEARGQLVKDAGREQKLMEAFARKYPEGWPRHEQSFREGFRTGERVLVAYTPD